MPVLRKPTFRLTMPHWYSCDAQFRLRSVQSSPNVNFGTAIRHFRALRPLLAVMGGIHMTSNRDRSPNVGSRRTFWGLSLVLAVAVALPEEVPADSMAGMTGIHAIARPDSPENEILLVHCCHSHPLPPYDSYCCHSGATVVVTPGYYGPASVRGQSRRVARRTTRRVSRRR